MSGADSLKVLCPGCGATLRIGGEHAGKKCQCPRCQEVFVAKQRELASATPGDQRGNLANDISTSEPGAAIRNASRDPHGVRRPLAEAQRFGISRGTNVLLWVCLVANIVFGLALTGVGLGFPRRKETLADLRYVESRARSHVHAPALVGAAFCAGVAGLSAVGLSKLSGAHQRTPDHYLRVISILSNVFVAMGVLAVAAVVGAFFFSSGNVCWLLGLSCVVTLIAFIRVRQEEGQMYRIRTFQMGHTPR